MASPKRLYTAVAVLVLVAVSLISISLYFKSAGRTSFLNKIVLEAVAPLGGAVNLAFGSLGHGWKRYVLLVAREKEVERMEGEIISLTREVNDLREMSSEFARLLKLMDMKEKIDFPSVAARVVGKNRFSVFQTLLINKGSADAIEIGFPVVAAEGVAGRVVEVSHNISKVLLLVDYNSNVDAIVQRSRCQGVLQGAGKGGCRLKYVQRSSDLRVGDQVVSSGLDGVFPKGLLLGTVSLVKKKDAGLFQEVSVRPILDIDKLEEVLVIIKRTGDS